jgi:hypothetical protein
MDTLTMKGKLIEKFEIQRIPTKKGNELIKQEFIVETDGDYPQPIKFTTIKDKVMAHLDTMAVGSEVEVSFNLRGFKGNKEGRTYYINDLQAWRVFAPESSSKPLDLQNVEFTESKMDSSDDDGLPF